MLITHNVRPLEVIGSISYRENYIWFNALIHICRIKQHKSSFRRSLGRSSLRG